MRGNIVIIHLPLFVIGNEDHHNVGLFGGFRDSDHPETIFLSSFPEGTIFTKANHDFHPTVMQVSGVGMALTTVTDDSDGFILYDFYIRVFVVVNLRQNFSPYLCT